ncbi:GntR family transcriptional regulator [Pseudomonas japonica]|uniref:GntR family transcriptional regulator n=1 Tax=Pseudomonas japonica TaxID=256466 RepID=UPI0015E48C36|nr:GntR family transcriptional regulator [Pseudomonas japonica]
MTAPWLLAGTSLKKRSPNSRSPVFQALRLLKKDGLIQEAPDRGVLVAPLTTDDISYLYLIRGTLDNLAAKMASEHKLQVDPAVIKRGRKASQSRNIKEMADAAVAFHAAFYDASSDPLIAQSA